MPHCIKSLLANFFFVILVTSPFFSVHAQLRQPYTGPLQIGNLSGNANYTFKVVDNDTTLDGTFEIKRSSLEALLQKSDSSFSITGQFDEGYPNGNWKFQFGEFKSDSTTQVVDYQYKLNVDGIQEEAFGSINRGKPDGIWHFNINEIRSSEISRSLFKSTIEFVNGVPQKSFQIESEENTLVGRFLRDGLAHDQWTLYSVDDLDATESWLFKDGWLNTVEIIKNEQSNSIDIYGQPESNYKVINMDSRYFQILKLKVAGNEAVSVMDNGMNATLKANAEQYEMIDGILSKLSKSSFYPEFKVKVGYFPLDSVELAQLDAIKALHTKSKKTSDAFLNNSQLDILRLSNERANYLYNATKTISEQFIDPLGQLIYGQQQGIVELVTRSELTNSLWPNGKPNTTLVIDDDSSETYSGPKANQFSFEGYDLATVDQMAQYAFGSLEAIATELNDKLTKDRRQQEYLSIEEQLIKKRKQLIQQVDSVLPSIPAKYGKALKNVQELANSNLAKYSKMEEGNTKLELGRKLVSCFDELQVLASVIALQPDRNIEIEEKYLDAIWNPFMATIMNEEVKKRIVTAYRKVLVPYLLDTATSDLSCENTLALTNLFESTHDRIIQMRDEETQKLERKLKRVQDPIEVLQLFNLQPLGEN